MTYQIRWTKQTRATNTNHEKSKKILKKILGIESCLNYPNFANFISSSKRDIYSNTILPLEIEKISK